MSLAETLRHVADTRQRLRKPENSVPDTPIDLKKKRRIANGPDAIPLRVPPAVAPYIAPRRYPSLEDITRVVCEHYGVTAVDLESERRTTAIVRPRQIWCYLARTMTPTSFPKMGRYLGGRDHSTTLYAYEKVRGQVLTDPATGIEVGQVQRKVEALFSCRNNRCCFDDREI